VAVAAPQPRLGGRFEAVDELGRYLELAAGLC
jgi:hypothetical protein